MVAGRGNDYLDFLGIGPRFVADGIRRVAVQIDQRLERALLVGTAGVHPVDRSVLVHLDVVVIKIVDEVFAQ